jgi:HEAT repeat protein
VRTDDEHVRSALVKAAHSDKNAAVRLKALDALRDWTREVPVRDALLDALHHDANPGVRVEAVNLLVNSLGGGDTEVISAEESFPIVATPASGNEPAVINGDGEDVGRVVRALEDLQRRDPNRYVRLRSAAALRQIGSRDMQ